MASFPFDSNGIRFLSGRNVSVLDTSGMTGSSPLGKPQNIHSEEITFADLGHPNFKA